MATVKHVFLPDDAVYRTTNFPQLTRAQGSDFPVTKLLFDAAVDEAAFWQIPAVFYGSGNLTITLYWYAETATSGDVIWGAQLAAVTPNTDSGSVETKALASANTATDTHLGTTAKRLHSVDITLSNLDSLAADDMAFIRIYRDADAGGDTMTGDASLLSVVAAYSDT